MNSQQKKDYLDEKILEVVHSLKFAFNELDWAVGIAAEIPDTAKEESLRNFQKQISTMLVSNGKKEKGLISLLQDPKDEAKTSPTVKSDS